MVAVVLCLCVPSFLPLACIPVGLSFSSYLRFHQPMKYPGTFLKLLLFGTGRALMGMRLVNCFSVMLVDLRVVR